MRAVVFYAHGGPEVLELVELERPVPGPGQARVRVIAGGIQPFDVGVRRGSLPQPVNFPQQLGNEFAGVIDDVGPGASPWTPGDAVIGWAFMRSLAEYVVADASALVNKPPSMSWTAAGGLSSSGQTALYSLRQLGVARGETLLVHAAAGGVGSAAVQLARAWGAEVIGTASEANHAYVAALGATPGAYGAGLVERVTDLAPRGVHAVLDAVGGQALRDSLALARAPRRIATLVDHAGAQDLGVRGLRAQLSQEQLTYLVDQVQNGALQVALRGVFPLEHVVAAHRLVETGHGAGKVVVTVGNER